MKKSSGRTHGLVESALSEAQGRNGGWSLQMDHKGRWPVQDWFRGKAQEKDREAVRFIRTRSYE